MSENKPAPTCPYCGHDMGKCYVFGDHFYKCGKCGALSPMKNTAEDAYTAAMKWERPKGNWIGVRIGDMRCSICGKVYGVCGGLLGDYNFCPNCGADMREEANDEP